MKSSSDQTSQTPQGADRRRILGYLVRPRQQLKYAAGFISVCLLLQGIAFTMTFRAINHLMAQLTDMQAITPEMAIEFHGPISRLYFYIVFSTAGLAVFVFLLGIKATHRLFGPVVPLKRHIEALRDGNYSSRVTLRETDELLELRDALNELAERLEKKS